MASLPRFRDLLRRFILIVLLFGVAVNILVDRFWGKRVANYLLASVQLNKTGTHIGLSPLVVHFVSPLLAFQ
jgi:hypothetical protein